MNLKLAILTLGAGSLIGGIIPLSVLGEMRAIRKTAPTFPRAATTRQAAAANDLEVPKEVTPNWAIGCATTSPDAFFRWLLKADPQPPAEIVEAFFRTWILRDPDSAFEAALLLPERFGYRTENRFFILTLWEVFGEDPATGFRWVSRIAGVLGDHASNVQSNSEVLETLDPDEIRLMVNRCPPSGMGFMMVNSYVQSLASRDPEAAVHWAKSLNVEYQNRLLPMLFYELAKKDPALALEYIKSAPSNIKQYATLFALGSESAGSVAEEMRWLEEEMGTTSYTGINNLLWKYYREDAQAAQDYVVSLGNTTQGIEAARGLAEAACKSGRTENAVAMIVTLPDSLQLEAARAAMLTRMPGDFEAFASPLNNSSLSGSNLEAYVHLLATFVDGERGQSFGRNSITSGIVDRSEYLAGFQNWLRDHPGPSRDLLIQSTYEILKDKPEMRDYVFNQLPPEELKRILGK